MPRLKDDGSDGVGLRPRAGRRVGGAEPAPGAGATWSRGRSAPPSVTLELARHLGARRLTSTRRPSTSGSPPRPDVKYQIEVSTDGGKTWRPVVKDWTVRGGR